MLDVTTVALALITGTVSVCLALFLARLAPNRDRKSAVERANGATPEPIALLFRDRRLVDATASARSLLAALPGENDWARLWNWLSQRFEAPDAILERAAEDGRAVITGGGRPDGSALQLRAEDLGQGLLRFEIVDADLEYSGVTVNAHSLAAMEEEIAILRESVDHAPVLIWREDRNGAVSWANGAYLSEIESQDPDEIRWPLPRLIALPDDADGVKRAEIPLGERSRWFDCHVQQFADTYRTIYAVPADTVVRAESSLREFVQTLTKTFADLPIGLAIFDRERRLQLFNPALTDLTGLSASFLTARPTLYAVLDSLREARMMPEPKDYASWRRTLATLEAGAASGHHVETWTLPGGQTYRVTGRPHPGGAIAFLFEDISSEITLTQRFKAELSLGAEILDALDSAVAIFDANGRLISTNQLFDTLWGFDTATTLRGFDQLWRRVAEDSPGYRALRAALSGDRADGRRSGAIAGPDQALLSWRVSPLSGGRRMVLFARTVAGTGEAFRGDLPPVALPENSDPRQRAV